MSLPTLYTLVEQHRELGRLADADDIDEAALRDTLEGLEGSIQIKAQSVAATIANMDAWADTVADAAEKLATRANRYRSRAAWLKSYLLSNMQQAGITKIETAELVASVRKNPASVAVLDESLVPDAYKVQPELPPKRVDKKAILADLKAGVDVPGCALQQGERLEIK